MFYFYFYFAIFMSTVLYCYISFQKYCINLQCHQVWIHNFTSPLIVTVIKSYKFAILVDLQYSCLENPMDGGAW